MFLSLYIYNKCKIRESEISNKIIQNTNQQERGWWNPNEKEKEILSTYKNLSRKDNVVIPAIDLIKQHPLNKFSIKRFVLK